MTIYYSKATGGFYDDTIHGSRTLNIVDPSWVHPTVKVPDPSWMPPADDPEATPPLVDVPDPEVIAPTITVLNPACLISADAVEITVDEHAALLAEQAAGKQIQANKDGRPVAIEPPLPPLDTLKAAKAGALTAAIAELEAEQHRATREALNALLAGTVPADIAKTPAGQRLAAIDSQAATLRALFCKIAAAGSAADLEAITW